MLFVPFPLFATLILGFIVVRLLATRDMAEPANRLFTLLAALYALQSGLLCLRWGYGIGGIGPLIALVAPTLPVCAYLAYATISDHRPWSAPWPLGVVLANWLALMAAPPLADPTILLTYLGFGFLILRRAWGGSDTLALTRIDAAAGALRAMRLTGAALVASALTDVYLIYDFARNDGQSVGLIVTFVQTAFILAIGISAAIGQPAPQSGPETEPVAAPPTPNDQDEGIVARLIALFETEGLHKDEDLSLRRLSRRLGLPDRSVSAAINRTRGLNVSQFVNDFRVKEACALLGHPDQTILQVSLTAGFATKSNFNREFLRVTGQTPSDWRHEALAGPQTTP